MPPPGEPAASGLLVPYVAVLDALDGHRAECPTFDVLMGLIA
jgi:hypothetical protein